MRGSRSRPRSHRYTNQSSCPTRSDSAFVVAAARRLSRVCLCGINDGRHWIVGARCYGDGPNVGDPAHDVRHASARRVRNRQRTSSTSCGRRSRFGAGWNRRRNGDRETYRTRSFSARTSSSRPLVCPRTTRCDRFLTVPASHTREAGVEITACAFRFRASKERDFARCVWLGTRLRQRLR